MREAVGIFDVSHLGKAMVGGPGAADVRQRDAEQRPRQDRARARRSTRCAATTTTGGIVDDLIAYFHDDEHVLLVPNAANTAEVVRRLAEAAPDGVKVVDHHRDYAVLAVQGTQVRRGARRRSGCPTGHDYMSFVEADFERHRRRGLPHRLHRRARLRADRPQRGRRRALGRAAGGGRGARHARRAGSAPATRCAPRWATRCTARTSRSTSRPTRPGSAGPSAGRRTRSGAATCCSPRRRPGPKRLLRGLVADGRGIPRPGMRVSLTPDVPLGEITSGTFSPDPAQGHRAGPGADVRQRRGRGRASTSAVAARSSARPSSRSSTRRCVSREPARAAADLPPADRRRAALVVAARGRRRRARSRRPRSYAGQRFASPGRRRVVGRRDLDRARRRGRRRR